MAKKTQKPNKISDPNIVAVDVPAKRSNLVFIGGLVIIVAVAVTAYLLTNRTKDQQPVVQQPTEKGEEQFSSEVYKRSEEIKDLVTIEGQVQSITGESIVIKSAQEQKQLQLQPDTYYRKESNYIKGEQPEVKIGQKAQVTYSSSNDKVFSVWYGL